MSRLSVLAAAAVLAVTSLTNISTAVAVDNIDFHGYFRSDVGISKDGGLTSWSKNYLGRLGNENDTQGEQGFGSKVYEANGVSFCIDSLFHMTANGSNDDDDENTNTDAVFGMRQFNVQIKGLIPNQPDAVLWAGKRFYQKNGVHLTDSDCINVSSAGAGLEYLKLGSGLLSLAWVRSDSENVDYHYDNTEDAISPDGNYSVP